MTVRGAGTGNYGQCVPLEGGIVLDLSLMDKLEEITADGVAVCQPGLRLGALETEARKQGWELRMYPSTLVKASVGGFLAGGSGGIGSVTHGGLRDFDTVRAFEVVTMEEEPRVVMHEGAAVHEILHAWGTNGVLTRIWFALDAGCGVDAVDRGLRYLSSRRSALRESIAVDAAWTKRLATVFEWPIPSFFAPVKQLVRAGKTLALIMIATEQAGGVARGGGDGRRRGDVYGSLRRAAHAAAAERLHMEPHDAVGDEGRSCIYLFAVRIFADGMRASNFRLLRERYGEEILFHIEFMKNGEGVVIPGAIPVVRFTTEERLNEMIAYCRSIGVFVANPHVNYLEDGGRFRADNIQLLAKQKYDPRGLLNPGKMISFRKHRR